MSIELKLDDLNNWADRVEDSLDSDGLRYLKREVDRLGKFITSDDVKETQKLSLIRAKIEQIETGLLIIRSSADDKKAILGDRVQQYGLVIADINQYGGNAPASTCTSCAAAFLSEIQNGALLDKDTIHRSIERGREIHTNLNREENANLAIGQVLEHRDLNLRRINSISGRPESEARQVENYQRNLLPQLKSQGNFSCAVLTKAPYSYAVAYQAGQFIFFDSHGEEETGNRAFIRTFVNENDFCRYLANKFGFYADFPDIDFDLDTEQDNPNLYELTLAEQRDRPDLQAAPVDREDQPQAQNGRNCNFRPWVATVVAIVAFVIGHYSSFVL